MGLIHDLDTDGGIDVGDYRIELISTDPDGGSPRETIEIASTGPSGDRSTAVIDRATWWLPEVAETRPNSPQYRRDPDMIHVSVVKNGNIGMGRADIVIEAPDRVPIDTE